MDQHQLLCIKTVAQAQVRHLAPLGAAQGQAHWGGQARGAQGQDHPEVWAAPALARGPLVGLAREALVLGLHLAAIVLHV